MIASTPHGWVETDFGSISEIKLGKMLDRDKNRGEPTRYLRNVNVRWGRIDLSDVNEMPMSAEERTELDIRNGDILTCEGGEPGRSAVWESGETELSFQKALMRVRPLQGINPHLLTAYLRYSNSSGDLERYFTGTTIKHLPQQALSRVSIPLAPLAEQRRIVAKIDSLSSQSKRAREHLDHIPRLVEKYKQAVLAAAFRGALTREWRERNGGAVSAEELANARRLAWESARRMGQVAGKYGEPAGPEWIPQDTILPTGWVWASVDQISFAIQYGSSAKTSEDSNGVAVLRMGNIQSGGLDLRNLKYLPLDHHEFPELLLSPGDVLFNRTNSAELVGKSAVYMGEMQSASFASYLIRVRCSGLLPSLLSNYINSAIGREWVATVVAQQVGQANVNGSKLRQLGIPVMPAAEQVEIIQVISKSFAWIDRLAAEAASARKLIDRLDQAVLAKAFRGELVPQDPNDEPASVLLERIRAEREAAPAASPRRGRAARS